ncbi:unnamed protein product, partial [Porites lobata]
GELIFLSALNIFLSIAAFLGNTLILVALHKKTSLHPPTKLLFRSLAISDLCVGIIVGPLAVTYWISVVSERWNICYFAYWAVSFSSHTLCAVSLLTLTAISVDRLLALLLGLRYRQIVTLKTGYITVISFWILSIVVASTIFLNSIIISWYQYIVIALCLLATIFSYTKIFFSLRQNRIHVQNHVANGQPSQAIPLNIARYRKAVYSALWVQVTLVVCYLPSCIAVALTPQKGMPLSTYLAREFTITLVYLNSSLNPLLYCWKITEVREAAPSTPLPPPRATAERGSCPPYGELIFLSALNIFLSIAAFLGNILILVALHKKTALHPPSKLLYRNLAISDLCVGIIVGPLAVTYWISVVDERWNICYFAYWAVSFSSHTLCQVSLLTMTAISVDRLLALLLGLRYKQIVTLKTGYMTIIGFWILS